MIHARASNALALSGVGNNGWQYRQTLPAMTVVGKRIEHRHF